MVAVFDLDFDIVEFPDISKESLTRLNVAQHFATMEIKIDVSVIRNSKHC